jgi:hypothetical protein
LFRRLSDESPAAVRQQLDAVSAQHKRQTRWLIALSALLTALLVAEFLRLLP